MNARLFMILAALAGLMTGCVNHTQRYGWGAYDPSLYAYYKDPTKEAALAESLTAIISTADSRHALVPPGIYAEYGYLQLQQGKNDTAVSFFRQEETHWPESKVFMDRMIKVASTASPSATK
jgi:hypothetical protein